MANNSAINEWQKRLKKWQKQVNFSVENVKKGSKKWLKNWPLKFSIKWLKNLAKNSRMTPEILEIRSVALAESISKDCVFKELRKVN